MEANTTYFLAACCLLALGVLSVLLLRRKGKKKSQQARKLRGGVPAQKPSSSPVSAKPVEPQIEKIVLGLKEVNEEFTAILNYLLTKTTAHELMKNVELKRKLSHIELLLPHVQRNKPPAARDAQAGPQGKSFVFSPDLQATMVSVVRILQEMPELQEKGGKNLNELVDAFLDRI